MFVSVQKRTFFSGEQHVQLTALGAPLACRGGYFGSRVKQSAGRKIERLP
jgi:hypothetical protein